MQLTDIHPQSLYSPCNGAICSRCLAGGPELIEDAYNETHLPKLFKLPVSVSLIPHH
jgi:hypothetical protein